MHNRTDLGRIGLKARTNDPADFPMCFYSPTDECSPGREYEISPHALPDEMELVVVAPHISSGAADDVRIVLIVVETRAWLINLSNIGLPLEQAQRLLPGRGGSGR